MSPSSDEAVPAMAQVLHYLDQHPGAHATIEEIGEWWSQEQRVPLPAAALRAALAELAARGSVSESRGPDGRIRYAAGNRRRP
jgi:hypothetical protein